MPDDVDLTKPLPRGAIPSPRHELAAAMPHVPDSTISVPASFLMWPVQMDSWNNYIYGDCVTAEEAFAKATAAPQTFIPQATVVAWASAHGVLNGASLTGVLTTMQTDGFPFNNDKYNDGPYNSVNWTNAGILQSAIYSHGPVKIGVGAGDFQSNAHGLVTPGTSGWAMYDYPANEPEDHCVSLCGYGTLAELVALFHQHGVTVNAPAGMPTGLCYAMFTWNSIGIIDQQSMLNMTYEAWIRTPVTIIQSKTTIDTSLGTINVDSGRPYAFVKGGDGNMWVDWWSGTAWSWANQGTPPGIGIASSMGAITVDGGRPYVFIKGSDGHLWVNWWSGSAWNWANQGTPPGIGIASSMGAITVDGGRPYAFVEGSDGNLWVNWWSGSAWNWADQGRPSGVNIVSSMGTINVDAGRPYAFVKGSDGHLWVNWWSGSAWNWANQGAPSGVNIVKSMGAITVDGGRPYVFVEGSDGNLWVNWWSGSAWNWSNQGRPSGVSIVNSMGAITVDGGRPYVFIEGSDGNLWVNWWSGSAWNWANQGRPSGVSIVSSMGAITVDGGRPYAFVKGSDGNLWVNWWSGSAWNWANQGRP